MDNYATFQAAHSTQGLPTFWEKRENSPLLTMVELMSDENFKPLRPVFLNRSPKIKKLFHAMFVAKIGQIICRAIRSTRSANVRFQLFVIMDIPQNADRRYSIFAEEIFSSNLIDDFEEKFGADVVPLLEAALSKLDSEAVESFFHLPHNLHEKAAKANLENK